MATKVWKGGAPPVAETQTVAITGTWANGDTATLEINEKKIVHTISGLTGNTQAWINSKLTDDWNDSEIPEFAEVTVVNTSNTVMTLTGPSNGKPFTFTTDETTAGNGELGDPAITQAGQGPNHFFLANNWGINGVPATGDLLIFEDSDVDCLYGLDVAYPWWYDVNIRHSFTGKVGLPRMNEDDTANPYVEYRTRFLKVKLNTITIGQGAGTGSGRLMFDVCNVKDGVINIYDSGSPLESGGESVMLVNTSNTSSLSISKGTVSVNRNVPESDEDFVPAEVHTLRIGYRDSKAGDVTFRTGTNTTLNTVHVSGGTIEVQENGIIALNMTAGDLTIYDGAGTNWDIDGGEVKYLGNDTLTTVRVGGGATLDFRGDMRGRTVTNFEIHKGGSVYDPSKTVTWSNGLDLSRCAPGDVTLDLGTHQTLTPSAI